MTEPLNTGSHDLPVTEELAAFMRTGWGRQGAAEVGARPIAPWAAKRRAALAQRFPGERLVIPAGTLKVRSNDCDYRFRPHSAYSYLTGAGESDDVLVIEPSGEAVLYVRPRAPREEGQEFYRDRRYGEFWAGPRPDLAEAAELYQIDCAHIRELRLDGPARVLRGVDASVDARVPRGDGDAELESFLSEMRLVKDEWEIGELQGAVDATARGFEDVVRALPQALGHPRGERYLEGVFGLRSRLEGNAVGYDSIVAAGAHACVLHWIRNDGALNAGDLLLMDAGVEADTLYTADVTRTIPMSGRFSAVQRQAYELVYEAQSAAIATLRPGARFRDFHLAAMRVICDGLRDWGLFTQSTDELMETGLYRRYTLCSSGHMLGLDVHDCAKSRAEMYLDGVLEEGHVLTVEPGLYLQPDDLTLPEELRGIGIRIEDDLVVTAGGARLMSSALPRHPDEIEAWMGALL
ncbi:Xaa-Pro aminopeptidase [[Actinomadura] parvosata subsp. kistnae]|uniref:Xaa-Pro aminopeptidase n=1 Tax=[Actinomadura] parvosata subsp. kistnae TaxID=1909395 RepID=A0A1V0A3F0_9ACTN|nr:aminopeptidase P family protein [Nonomuraea sp. ATCC 55076]AQZ64679.1 Xaa-Pro aminopeptidase [Nonomuraea sp. ATCC 55076]SPL98588.1 Xaa-Pro aminopeptidase [Actinomadura parvosata subsp. kistnae]